MKWMWMAVWVFLVIGLPVQGEVSEEPQEQNKGQEPELTFEQALEAILGRSPQLAIQKNELAYTQGKNLPDHLALLPTLSLSAAQTYNIVPGVINEQVRTYQATTQFNLFHFGADVSAMRAADAEEENKTLLISDAILKVEAGATKAVIGVISAIKTQAILQQITDVRRSSVDIANERYKKGLLAIQEVNKVVVDFDNANSRLNDAEIETVRAKADLANLLGHSNVRQEWPWTSLFYSAYNYGGRDPDLSQRPDWRAARKKVEGAAYRMGETWSKFLPSLDLNLSYGLGQDLVQNQSGPTWGGGVTLTVPLFDRLTNYGEYRAQVATHGTAEMEFERVKRQARADWESNNGTFQTALTTAKARDKTLETSHKIFTDNLRRFRQGLVSANDLVFDSDRLAESELFAIKGWANVHQTFIARCHAQGIRVMDCLSKVSAVAKRGSSTRP